MTQNLKAKLFASLLVAGAFLVSVASVYAVNATVFKNNPVDESRYHTFFTATTTSATSTANILREEQRLTVAGANKVVFYFSRGGATGPNTGSSKFEVEVSPDGTNWYDFNRLFLTDVSQTATSTVWITAATSTVVASLDIEDSAFLYARCQVVEVTDGEHTCNGYAEF